MSALVEAVAALCDVLDICGVTIGQIVRCTRHPHSVILRRIWAIADLKL